MSKGRKKTPTALKKLRGTNQPCRINENEMPSEVISKLPLAPRWFSNTQKRIYRSKGVQLIAAKILTVLDFELFISFCREYGNYIETSKTLDNYSTMDMLATLDFSNVDIENKEDVIDALMAGEDFKLKRIEKKNKESWERAKALASEFGFTPSARAKIVTQDKQDNNDSDFD